MLKPSRGQWFSPQRPSVFRKHLAGGFCKERDQGSWCQLPGSVGLAESGRRSGSVERPFFVLTLSFHLDPGARVVR